MIKKHLLHDLGVDGCEVHWLAIWLDQVNGNPTVPRPKHPRLDFDHPGEIGRIADRADAFAMPAEHPKVLGSLKVSRAPIKIVHLDAEILAAIKKEASRVNFG